MDGKTVAVVEWCGSKSGLEAAMEHLRHLDELRVSGGCPCGCPGQGRTRLGLKVDPVELAFNVGSWQAPVTKELTIANTSDNRLAFKIKCTANDLFKIRPVMGILGPGEAATAALTFRPDGAAPPSRHHFSLYEWEPKEGAASARDIWAAPEAKAATSAMRIPVSVAFVPNEPADKPLKEATFTAALATHWLNVALILLAAVCAAFSLLDLVNVAVPVPAGSPRVGRNWAAQPAAHDILRPFNPCFNAPAACHTA